MDCCRNLGAIGVKHVVITVPPRNAAPSAHGQTECTAPLPTAVLTYLQMTGVGHETEVHHLAIHSWPVKASTQVILDVTAACVFPLIGTFELLAAELTEDLSHGLADNISQHVQTTCGTANRRSGWPVRAAVRLDDATRHIMHGADLRRYERCCSSHTTAGLCMYAK